MRNKEYSWYMLSNASGFGAKSIHYIFNNLQKNSLSIKGNYRSINSISDQKVDKMNGNKMTESEIITINRFA